ncbi:MAG: hypothetical protein JW876_10930 [Candidatus Krumholzibacteriota bacterium]|nr:hypothetical protein [Candidatus Krumholzibacteriota bacterium]
MTRHRTIHLLLACTAGLALSMPVAAGERVVFDMRLAAFGGFRLADSLRIETVGGPLLEGRLVGSRFDSLYLFSAGEERIVPLEGIDAIWVRGNALRKGARTGAIAGCIAGIAFGIVFEWFMDEICDTGDCGNTTGETIGIMAFWTASGSALGALTGAGIGWRVPAWHLRYESPDHGASRAGR